MISIEQILKEGGGSVEDMSYGMFNNRGYYGYSSKVLKSGICKYFRREYFDKFEWCCMEMMLFGVSSSGLVSNLCNRLNILVMEEVCCDSENLVESVKILTSLTKTSDLLEKIKGVKRFCEVVKGSKRGRICSYVNNWWKYNPESYSEKKELDKVLKYKKKGDSDELLELGERLIEYLNDDDERLFDIYSKMYEYGKNGRRYRRVDGVYLYWEIIEEYFCKNENNVVLFKFALDMFNRKSMKERRAFGIWIGLMVLNRERLEYKQGGELEEVDIENYLLSREKIEIDEDFVVNDWHVNKKFGKKKFGEVGSFVENEDMSLLGDNFVKYKEFYMKKKGEEEEMDKVKKVKRIVKKRVVKVSDMSDMNDGVESVDFYENFKVVKILNDGVCGMKKPCVIVDGVKDGKRYVLKEMSVKGMSAGIDYMFMDSLKGEFGLVDLEMKRIMSNVGFVLVDKSIRKYRDNCILEEKKEKVYYCQMVFLENSGDLVNTKELLKDPKVMEEMLKIRLYDGLFRSSDNNMRNILVGEDNRLISIDEGDIFGKRVTIFDKNDWSKKSSWCRENIDRIVEEFIYKEGRMELVVARLGEYKYNDVKIGEFSSRYENFRQIVKNEFS
jgi:hypothetical protein